jgi:hemolysin III
LATTTAADGKHGPKSAGRTIVLIDRDRADELANTLTHALGFALSVAGLVFLLTASAEYGTTWQIAGCSIFGASLVLLYGVSTLYHGVTGDRWKALFRVSDHVCIFFLIAGSYTPFLISILPSAWGWVLLILIWLLAIGGALVKIFYANSLDTMSSLPYLVMGWLAVVAVKPMLELMPTGALLWILAGGLCYSFGVIFYVKDDVRYFHAVWHLFVLAGSACHYCAVMMYIVPTAVL